MFTMPRLMIGFLLASILSVRATVDLSKVFGSINNIVEMYDSELDKAVPMREMRASLTVLDGLAQSYTGSSRPDIRSAARLGYAAADSYYISIDAIFTWCVKAEKSCSLILQEAESYESNKSIMLLLTKRMLEQGLIDILWAVNKLEQVRNVLSQMRATLTPLPSSLKRELADIRWDYTQRRNERIRNVQKEQHSRDVALAVSTGSMIALALMGGPVGAAIGLIGASAAAGIPPAVLDGEVEATEAQKLEIVETFLRSLTKAVELTIERIHSVRDEMHKEITYDHGLRGFTSGSLDIIEDMEAYPLSRIKKLKQTVSAFIKRHGGGTYRSRERREILSQDMRWEEISHAVDALLNATAMEREVEYWTLEPLQGSPAFFFENNLS